MLAVHLENGAVTVRDVPLPAASRGLRAAAPAGRRHLQYRSRTAARLLRLRRHARPRVRRRGGGGRHAAPWSASAWPARSTSPARTANGAAAAWDATAPTAPCWESSSTPAPSPNSSRCRSAISTCCPTTCPPSRAVFLEPLAAACEILDQVSIPAGERIAVLGDGKLGLLIAHGAERARLPGAPIRPARRQTRDRRARGRRDGDRHGRPSRRRLRLGGRCHRQPRRSALRRRHDPPARHRDPEIHGPRHGRRRYRADHRQRAHAGRLALRPIRSRAPPARPPPRSASRK